MNEKNRPGEKAAIPTENRSHSTAYPRRIHLTGTAEAYLEQLGADLLLGRVELAQLPPSLLQLWTFGYENGRESLHNVVEQLNYECDRLYHEMVQRQPRHLGQYISWNDLQKRRNDLDAHNAGHYAGGSLEEAWGIK